MNIPPPSPRVRPKRGARSIVDPKAWDSADVGGQEAKAMSGRRSGGRRNAKVSSMRSSLFQRNAKNSSNATAAGSAAGAGAANARDADTPLFTLSMEADALNCPFSFEACPALTFCEYGKPNRKAWPRDVLAVSHNAVRAELKHLTVVLYALQRLGKRLTVGDVQVVRGWVHTCVGIVLDYLDMEGRVLVPWYNGALNAVGADALPGGAGEMEKARKAVDAVPSGQNMLRDVIGNVSRTIGELCDVSSAAEKGKNGAQQQAPMTMAQQTLLLLGSLDALVSETCDHMQRQEEVLVPALAAAYKCEKKEWKSIWSSIVRQYGGCARNSDAMLALLTRGLSDVKAAKNVAKSIEEVHNCKYSNILQEFEQGHGSFAQQLHARVEEVENEIDDA